MPMLVCSRVLWVVKANAIDMQGTGIAENISK